MQYSNTAIYSNAAHSAQALKFTEFQHFRSFAPAWCCFLLLGMPNPKLRDTNTKIGHVLSFIVLRAAGAVLKNARLRRAFFPWRAFGAPKRLVVRFLSSLPPIPKHYRPPYSRTVHMRNLIQWQLQILNGIQQPCYKWSGFRVSQYFKDCTVFLQCVFHTVVDCSKMFVTVIR